MNELNEIPVISDADLLDMDDGAFAVQEEQDMVQMVGFFLADALFGTDILAVQEILKEVAITTVPDTPDFISGVINLRGRIVPVLDLRRRLGLTAAAAEGSDAWTIILNIGGRVTGFLVDRVTRVLKVPAAAIEPPADTIPGEVKREYVSGLAPVADQTMVILDFNRVLAVDEIKRLAEQKRQQG